jgi:hypothetical protein
MQVHRRRSLELLLKQDAMKPHRSPSQGEPNSRQRRSPRKYSSDKDLARFIKQLVASGWRFRYGGKHNRLESPKGFFIVTPISPGCHRTVQNLRRLIARKDRLCGG